MGLVLCVVLLAAAPLVFDSRSGGSVLAKALWVTYFALGVAASIIAITGVLQPTFPPNYGSALYLSVCVLLGLAGFVGFRASDLQGAGTGIRGRGFVETLLIASQLYAMAFFLPFAVMSLMGDAKDNRLELEHKMALLGSFGWWNTLAGAGAQLFTASLVMACLRLARPHANRRDLLISAALGLGSLSFVVYSFAYVGRDGVVYWAMTAAVVAALFRQHLPARRRQVLISAGTVALSVMLLPFAVVTVARFTDWEHGAAWSLLEYFGQQINTFSDYSSIDRPMTMGVMNFPMFATALCPLVGLECESWTGVKDFIFELYLAQDKEPWLFGTYVSDFVGDFGYLGAFVFLSAFALLCHAVSRHRARRAQAVSLSRLLLVLLLFLVPYWGVFYFRFSIANSFIVVNMALITFIWLLERLSRRRITTQLRDDARSQPEAGATASTT